MRKIQFLVLMVALLGIHWSAAAQCPSTLAESQIYLFSDGFVSGMDIDVSYDNSKYLIVNNLQDATTEDRALYGWEFQVSNNYWTGFAIMEDESTWVESYDSGIAPTTSCYSEAQCATLKRAWATGWAAQTAAGYPNDISATLGRRYNLGLSEMDSTPQTVMDGNPYFFHVSSDADGYNNHSLMGSYMQVWSASSQAFDRSVYYCRKLKGFGSSMFTGASPTVALDYAEPMIDPAPIAVATWSTSLATDTAFIVWQDRDAQGGLVLKRAVVNGSCSFLVDPEVVSTNVLNGQRVAVAAFYSGFVVAWTGEDNEIYMRTYSPSGTPLTSAFAVGSKASGTWRFSPRLDAHRSRSENYFVVSWQELDTTTGYYNYPYRLYRGLSTVTARSTVQYLDDSSHNIEPFFSPVPTFFSGCTSDIRIGWAYARYYISGGYREEALVRQIVSLPL